MPETLEIPARFNGPPGSANGGYTCGLVAALLGDGPAKVTLRAPPPLDTPLEVRRSAASVELLANDQLVAEAAPAALELGVPGPVAPAEAERASAAGYERWAGSHPFPTCVVCGPERGEGDGMQIFPGELGDGRFAACWTPHAAMAGPDGIVPVEIVWAALDCPTSAPVVNFGNGPACVLARLTASLGGPVMAGRQHALVSWPIEVDGRKRHSGVALFDDAGRTLACARALWIELRE